MNIRDYLFIKKAKSSNKIKILDVLGFETDTTIIQTPEIIKAMDSEGFTADVEISDEISIPTYESEFIKDLNNDFEETDVYSNTDTQTFTPLNVTSQLRKIWTDLEQRRRWVMPTLLSIVVIIFISFSSVFLLNMRSNNIQDIELTNTIKENTNIYINQLPDLLAIATDPFYSRYDISNASANLQIIQSNLLTYQDNLNNRDIDQIDEVNLKLANLFQIIEKLDQIFTYRIMYSEILIYNDVLNIDENTDIDKLAEDLSIIGSKSVLNGESLPVIDEFDSHTQIVNSALSTAQDLHGRLVASLRNNEIDVAQGLISAIKLNKESEVNFFNKTIDEFNQTYLIVLNEIGELP